MELEKWQADKFESIKHIDENGDEFWLARELQSVLDYAQWRRFCDVIDRAMVSCKLNEQEPKFHFAETEKSVEMPTKPKKRPIEFWFCRRWQNQNKRNFGL